MNLPDIKRPSCSGNRLTEKKKKKKKKRGIPCVVAFDILHFFRINLNSLFKGCHRHPVLVLFLRKLDFKLIEESHVVKI